MKSFFLTLVLFGMIVAGSFAQVADRPVAGTFGLTASVSDNVPTVGGLYYATDNVLIAPFLGYFSDTQTTKNPSGSTDVTDATFLFGTGVYYELAPVNGLFLDLGPSFYYSNRSYKSGGDSWADSTLGIRADFIVRVAVVRNFAIFSTFGAYYESTDSKDTTNTNNQETLHSRFGLQTLNLGVAYYFR